MRLALFILGDIDRIVGEWETFAATQWPAAQSMTQLALRDDAEQILRAIANDLSTPQTNDEQVAKSLGRASPLAGATETAAQTHGLLRAKSGFDINQMASEYRALRACVLRMWMDACGAQGPNMDDVMRFNEAIDQALAESIAYYCERVDQARSLFLGMLGHDMRTPLQAIQMTAIHLGQMNAGETVSVAALRLMRSGKRMQALLDDLVDFNRINLGLGIPIRRQRADIGELFAEELSQLQAAHPRRRVELEVRGSTAGSWDGMGLQRMLENLVVNALKYGLQDAPVRVIVNGRERDVSVEVRNEGAPIDPSVLQSLFDPLRRGLHENQPDRAGGHLGLGLYISREVVRAHGGDIHVQIVGNETVFEARLPRQEQA